ncbi:MAG TPA: nitronate monooxygenase family protein [candidate division Zixibacteria bacterium]|nr:nitronate monooxygenase family protein [candidate division Zixibacteria bacterium]
MLRTPLCDLLGIEVPIIQAGMGWDKAGTTTPPELVAAVSNAGGLGVIGGSPLRPELIRERIRRVKELTERPFGVDITLPKMEDVKVPDPLEVRRTIAERYPEHLEFASQLIEKLGLEPRPPDTKTWVKTPAATREQLRVILEEGVPVLVIGLGDTAEVVPLAHEKGIKVMALAGAVKHAVSHARKGADVIIAQGYEAGGHTGTIANFPLIPQIVDAVRPIPVVAAGGIADGRGVAAALALGAVGVWCGTAFLLAEECRVHPVFKGQLLRGKSEDFVRTAYTSGHFARHFRSAVIQAWMDSGLAPLPTPYQGALMDEIRCAAEGADRIDVLHVPGGQIAGLLNESNVKPAKKIVDDMAAEASRILKQLASDYTPVKAQ